MNHGALSPAATAQEPESTSKREERAGRRGGSRPYSPIVASHNPRAARTSGRWKVCTHQAK